MLEVRESLRRRKRDRMEKKKIPQNKVYIAGQRKRRWHCLRAKPEAYLLCGEEGPCYQCGFFYSQGIQLERTSPLQIPEVV